MPRYAIYGTADPDTIQSKVTDVLTKNGLTLRNETTFSYITWDKLCIYCTDDYKILCDLRMQNGRPRRKAVWNHNLPRPITVVANYELALSPKGYGSAIAEREKSRATRLDALANSLMK